MAINSPIGKLCLGSGSLQVSNKRRKQMSYEVTLLDSTYTTITMLESIDYTVRQLNQCEMAGNAIKELLKVRARLLEKIGNEVVMAARNDD
jgi:hypothetical protein